MRPAIHSVTVFPRMVGAGVLIQPLLGFQHWQGVVLVGATVMVIVVTAGMVSTTWVQFLKGSLLVAFSTVLTVMILMRGFEVQQGGIDGHQFRTLGLRELGRLGGCGGVCAWGFFGSGDGGSIDGRGYRCLRPCSSGRALHNPT